MELIAMIVTALPLGFLVRSRIAAYVAYIAIQAFVFTFQSLQLVVEWTGGSTDAFGPYPDADSAEVWAYGAVNLLIFAVGLGLVALGRHLAGRRRNRSAALDLEASRS